MNPSLLQSVTSKPIGGLVKPEISKGKTTLSLPVKGGVSVDHNIMIQNEKRILSLNSQAAKYESRINLGVGQISQTAPETEKTNKAISLLG